MKLPRLISASALILLMAPLIGSAQTVVETRVVSAEPVIFAKRTTLAVKYPVDKDTKIDLDRALSRQTTRTREDR
jgi:hypothetical protein